MAALGSLLAALAYGVNQIDTRHFLASLATPGVWAPLLAAAALLPVFWLVERRAQDPILHLALFGAPQVVLASLLAAGAGLGESGLVFMPPLAVAALGLKASAASFMLMPVVLAISVGSPLAGRLLDKVGSRVVVLAGAALLAAGMALLGSFATSLPLFITAGLVIGLGLSALLGAPVRYIMLNEAPASEQAAAQGAIALFTGIGQLMSGALVGAGAASQGGGVAGDGAAYLVIGGVALVLAVLALGLKGRAEELATLKRNEQHRQDSSARTMEEAL